MTGPDIGVDVDDFHLRAKDAFRQAAELKLRTVEFAATSGELDPGSLTSSGRRHLTRIIDGLGLRIGAIVADLPGLRLTDPQTVDERVERTGRILDLAADLHVPFVTASASALTHPETGDPSPAAVEALRRIGEMADSRGVVYAMRPSGDTGPHVKRLLDALGCPSIGVGLDPGAMVIDGVNPLALIDHVPDRLVMMHARDATAGLAGRTGHETRFGEGEVDLIGVFARLGCADYHGPYIIRRTDSQRPVADIEAARDRLIQLLPVG